VASPGQQRRVFSKQPFEYHDVVVVNGAMRLGERPLEIVVDALAGFSHEVPPSSEAVLPRECELSSAQRHGSLTRNFLGLLAKGFERRTRRDRTRSAPFHPPSSIRPSPPE